LENKALQLGKEEASMKKLGLAAAVVCAFAPAAFADSDRIRANLTGLQEVPVVSTTGTGRVRLEVISDTEVRWELTYEAMESTVTQAHIHIAQRNVNGGIVLWFCGTTLNVPNVTNTPGPSGTQVCTSPSGSFSGTFSPADVQTVAAQHFGPPDLAEVIRFIQAGLAYANVHTLQSPGGEIRGQTRRGDGGRHDHDD
jgi:hypothetical protein